MVIKAFMEKTNMILKDLLSNQKYFILILFLILGWFYWTQYRPSVIRKNCYLSTQKEYERLNRHEKSYFNPNPSYQKCLSKNGMKSEKLLQ
jgi:uncharacterized protein YxeA